MIRLTRQTDLGIQLMVWFASAARAQAITARELSEKVRSSAPLVSKALKLLSKAGLLDSHRGKNGGYVLSRPPEEISIADLVEAIEGPIALTECASSNSSCEQEDWCPVGSNMKVINQAIHQALDGVSLAKMAMPGNPALMQGSTRDGSARAHPSRVPSTGVAGPALAHEEAKSPG